MSINIKAIGIKAVEMDSERHGDRAREMMSERPYGPHHSLISDSNILYYFVSDRMEPQRLRSKLSRPRATLHAV